jgi:Predicted membrane protein (DUF2306)
VRFEDTTYPTGLHTSYSPSFVTNMTPTRSITLPRVLALVSGLLVWKVTVSIMAGYVNYLPPDFTADFLRGREGYFFGAYRWAFYSHIASGPVSLFLGVLLVSDSFRARFPKWHRWMGRLQVVNVLFIVSPSGLWMAWYTQTGPIAGVSFAILAVLTGFTAAMGWRAAVRRKFAIHRVWMWRNFVLLCSAVVLRLFVGLGTVVGVQSMWFDPVVSWLSWVVPVLVYELRGRFVPQALQRR